MKIFRKFIRRLYRGRMMSVRAAMFWHRLGNILFHNESPLLPSSEEMTFATCNINNTAIRTALSSTKLTRWTLDVESINWLSDFVADNKCKRVLEFGSGTSSLVFANLCMNNGGEKPIVVSLDQDESFIEPSKRLLQDNEVAKYVEIIHCPLAEREYELGGITGYNITNDTFVKLPNDWKANMVFVDGPATDGWGRLPAIIDCMDYMTDDCLLIMDDAFRNDEMKIVDYLNKNRDWQFMGFAVVSKGIAVARRNVK